MTTWRVSAPNRPACRMEIENKMKRYIAPALATMFVASAAFADVPEQLLYLRQVRVSDVVVNLPTLQKSDGSVCMSYLSSTSRDSAGRLNIRVDQICDKLGKARESVLSPGQMEVRPANVRGAHSTDGGQ